jgi:sugar lactone lactonase YvrE
MRAPSLVGFLLAAGIASAQTYVISTLAGSGAPATPVKAPTASIGDPPRVAVDAAGNVYFGSLHTIFKVDAAGNLTRFAGNGRGGYTGDGGLAVNAQLLNPIGMAFDAAGSLYVADHDANVVRKIAPDGTITTAAGAGGQLNGPFGVAVDTAGNVYVSDTGNQRVVRFGPDGNFNGSVADGLLNGPEGLAIDSAGNLYIADTFNGRIRKVTPDGTVSVVAGTGSTGIFSGDNHPAINAALSLPTEVAVDAGGNLFIADFGNSRIRTVNGGLIAPGIISTVAGSTGGAPIVDGEEAVNVLLNGPTGVAADRTGNFYFVEAGIRSGTGLAHGDYKVYKVSTGGLLTLIAGTGVPSFSGDDGPAVNAQISGATGVAADAAGNVYIADTANHRLRRVANGMISTIAGNGSPGFTGESVAPAGAQLNTPAGVAVDNAGRVYIADTDNSRVRGIDPGGNIFTFAGNGNASYFGDGGPARAGSVNQPQGVGTDAAGNVYIADTLDNAVLKVGLDGTITTIAGTGTAAFSGDGGPAVRAALNHPRAATVDPTGVVYIADTGNNRVRKIDAQGNISTVADGLGSPGGVAVDTAGNLYIADTGHNRILRGTTVIAGTGECCYSGDGGLATAAQLHGPANLAVDGAGNIYIADAGNSAVRVLRPVSATIAISAVTNGASNQTGSIAPGEVVSIYGSGLADVKSVLFNGIPAPLLYTIDAQVGAVAPYGLDDQHSASRRTEAGTTSVPVSVVLASTAPGVFTIDGSGRGQASAINQDGSTNGTANPAPAGSVISLYAPGEGQTTPAGVDG